MHQPRPIAFVLAAAQHGTMIVNRHDFHASSGGTYGVGHQILTTGAFDPAEISTSLQLLSERRRHVGDGVVALDCGANIGVHTLEWAKHMHGWGEILAIEAQERLFYALCGNLALNNCFNARAIWAAVGEASGVIRVPMVNYLAPGSYGSLELKPAARNEFIGQEIDYTPEYTIATTLFTIDSLALARLDFIKLDIEGMEMEALRGAEASIQRFKPQLLIEQIKLNHAQLRDYLEARDYLLYPAGINLLAIHRSDPTAQTIRVDG